MSEPSFQADVKPEFKKSMDKPKSKMPAANQTTQPVTQTQPMQPVEQAAGFGEAMSSLLSTGGTISFKHRRPGSRQAPQATYKQGAIAGMTQDQAVEYGKQQWEKVSPEIREKYANRVQNRPAASEKMAAFNQMDQVEQAQANVNDLPGSDENLVENPETGTQITNRTPQPGSGATPPPLKPQWKKPMDKPYRR